MAAFDQGPWQNGIQQHSLRCISGAQNKVGANSYVNFKDGTGDYGRTRGKKSLPGKWEQYRSAKHNDPFPTFEKFIVQPNFESFAKTGDKKKDDESEEIRKLVQWCEPPKGETKIDCTNDGRFFHMETLRKNGKDPLRGDVYVTSPYSTEVSSTWRVDKEEADIQEYHVQLYLVGDNVEADVAVYEKKVIKTAGEKWRGDRTILDERRKANLKKGETLELKADDSFTLKGDLPLALEIKKKSDNGCVTYEFTYGDAKLDGHRAFAFKSSNKGLGNWSHTEDKNDPDFGAYCVERDMAVAGSKQPVGTVLYCSFPGW